MFKMNAFTNLFNAFVLGGFGRVLFLKNVNELKSMIQRIHYNINIAELSKLDFF